MEGLFVLLVCQGMGEEENFQTSSISQELTPLGQGTMAFTYGQEARLFWYYQA